MRGNPPRSWVTVHQLVGRRAVTTEQAARNRARRCQPSAPRVATPGLVLFDAATLWQLVERGKFPAPVRSPWGWAWPRIVVMGWLQKNEAPQAVGRERGPEKEARNAEPKV